MNRPGCRYLLLVTAQRVWSPFPIGQTTSLWADWNRVLSSWLPLDLSLRRMWRHPLLPRQNSHDRPVCCSKGHKYAYICHKCSEIRRLASCRSSSWNQWLVLGHTNLQLGHLCVFLSATRVYPWVCLPLEAPSVSGVGSMVRMKMAQPRSCWNMIRAEGSWNVRNWQRSLCQSHPSAEV